MTNRYIIPDGTRCLSCGNMHHGVVLNIGSFADADAVDVTANDRVKPDAGIFPDDGIADDASATSEQNVVPNLGLSALKRDDMGTGHLIHK